MGGAAAAAVPRQEIPQGGPGCECTSWGPDSEIDWLLVGQTKASLVAGACLAIGLRFAGTSDLGAKRLLIARMRAFRDARRSTLHPALMASLPTRGMDLDRSTLETCQSVVAVSLGMVMAGTGDLSALRILRSLRKRADLETGYGVHMATHTAIGFVFLGGGKYTFDQEPMSIAALLMAAFPRWPTSLTDNRCHLQAFRHLHVLAARHHCVEAVEVDTRQPVDVHVSLEGSRGVEMSMLPRLMLASGDVHSITLRTERYWPVTIQRSAPGDNGPATGRWMQALESSRRLYVKRRSGHLPHRLDGLGAQGAAQAWFPTFTTPSLQHLERLLQIRKVDAGVPTVQRASRAGGLVLAWLRRADAESGGGPLELGTLAVSSAEWAAALCCEPPAPLPSNVYEFDFEDEGDGSLSERFAALLRTSDAVRGPAAPWPPHVRFAHWLHECILESKLDAYPRYVLVYLQTCALSDECAVVPAPLCCGPSSLVCSAMAVDQLLTVELFYRVVRGSIGARHRPLLSEDFLIGRCAVVREAFAEGGPLASPVAAALSEQLAAGAPGAGGRSGRGGGSAALVALFTRLHGLPGCAAANVGNVSGAGSALAVLPRLRRQFPGASVQGLRVLAASLSAGGA